MSAEELREMLAKVRAGDYVTAFGRDTRGHNVTREGVLLDTPKEVKATYNGAKVAAVRVCIGLKGTDPLTRSTWTTLFPEQGFIRLAKAPTSGDWTNGPVKDIPGIRVTGAVVRIMYGGKGGKRSTEPTEGVLSEIARNSQNRFEIRAVESGELLWTAAYATQVWWAPAPEAKDQDQDQDQDQDRTDVEDGRRLGLDQGEALDLADERRKARKAVPPAPEPDQTSPLGQPVYHVVTGDLVGYWTLAKFTPAE